MQFVSLTLAEEEVMCIIFTGKYDTEYAADLAQYKRIYFKEEAMTLSNPDEAEDVVDLPYSIFNILTIGKSNPNVEIESTTVDPSHLTYIKEKQVINLNSTEPNVTIEIYTTNGTCVAKSNTNEISTLSFPSGVYVAIAKGLNSMLTLKFIK